MEQELWFDRIVRVRVVLLIVSTLYFGIPVAKHFIPLLFK
jgi:hypothetical protein